MTQLRQQQQQQQADSDNRSQVIDEIIRNLNDQVSSELEQQRQQQQAGSTLTAANLSPPVDGSLDVNYNKTKRLKEEDESRSGGDVDMTSSDRPGNFILFFFKLLFY